MIYVLQNVKPNKNKGCLVKLILLQDVTTVNFIDLVMITSKLTRRYVHNATQNTPRKLA
jgi:hypothetical protein